MATQYTEVLTNTVTGVAAGSTNIVAEVMDVVYVNGSRTYVSFSPAITDTFALTVTGE